MSARNSGKNFFQTHWDWLVAIAGIAVAALSVVMNFVLSDETEPVEFAPGRGKDVAPVNMERYIAATNAFANPHQLAEIDGEKASFLASGLRVFCAPGEPGVKGCGMPIPFPSEKCPFCGKSQKEEEKPTEDHDGDGLPDEWEKLHGLNPLDPADADEDKDDDGFTNLEEFEAKTDPSDSTSHPDYLAYLKLDPVLSQKYTTLTFVKVAYKLPDGRVKLEFKDPKFAKDYSRGVFTVTEGEEIGKTGFSLKKYEEKSRSVRMGGGMERKEDVSVAIVVRKSDKKEISLVKGAKRTPTDVEAKVLFDRIASKGVMSFSVVPGREIDINSCKYRVESIEKLGGSNFQIVVTSLGTNEKRIIKALEQ